MQQEQRLHLSELQAARNTHNRKLLEERFNRAGKTLAAGGVVRVVQEFSDTRTETVHIIDTEDELRRFAEQYRF